jgi:hypothetical protein
MTSGEWRMAIKGPEYLALLRKRLGKMTGGYDRVARQGEEAAFYRERGNAVEVSLLRWPWESYESWEEQVIADILLEEEIGSGIIS